VSADRRPGELPVRTGTIVMTYEPDPTPDEVWAAELVELQRAIWSLDKLLLMYRAGAHDGTSQEYLAMLECLQAAAAALEDVLDPVGDS
jgi:hypothetical protein